jgi:hypothetical protein
MWGMFWARSSVIRAGVLVLVLLSASVSCGCSRVVGGAATAQVTAPLPRLLIDPSRFPPAYSPVVLAPDAADRALRAIDGVPDGAKVSPTRCAPPAPRGVAAILGEDGDRSLIVAVSHADASLRERRDQLSSCPTFSVDDHGTTSTVRITMLASPPVGADDSCAFMSRSSQRATLTLVAQFGDVRVTATAATAPGAMADTEALDGLFGDAVLTARHGGPV